MIIVEEYICSFSLQVKRLFYLFQMKVKGQTEAKKTDQESKKKEDKKKNGVKQQQENIKKSKESLSAPQRDPATLILQNRY